MKDYKNGKIYVIRNRLNDMVYIGSTIQGLAERMGGHRSAAKEENKKSYKLYQAINEYGVDKFHIELIEMFPCEFREELHKREGYFIREYNSYSAGYNGNIVGQTPKEYREANKHIFQEKSRKYCEINKTARAERSKEWREINKDKAKEHRDANKEKIREKNKENYQVNKEKYICKVCNCEITLCSKIRHEKCKKHIANTLLPQL
jgi:group I intron endonuclease